MVISYEIYESSPRPNDVESDIIVSSEVSHILCNIRLYDYLPTNRNLRNYHMYTCVKNNKNITVGWLVVLDLTAIETVFQSISGRLPERGRKKREMIDERKKTSKQPPPAPTASAVGPCPTIIQSSRTPRH